MPPAHSLGSQSYVVERVALGSVEGRAGHTEDLVQDVADRTELVILHGHLTLQMWDHHSHSPVHRLQRFQLQLTLQVVM